MPAGDVLSDSVFSVQHTVASFAPALINAWSSSSGGEPYLREGKHCSQEFAVPARSFLVVFSSDPNVNMLYLCRGVPA